MIYKTKPKDFKSKFDVVNCFCEFNGKFILLQRQDFKLQRGQLGLPGGKKDDSETSKQAIIREVKEETGISIKEDSLVLLGKFFVKYPDYDFVNFVFRTKLEKEEEISISLSEHKSFL